MAVVERENQFRVWDGRRPPSTPWTSSAPTLPGCERPRRRSVLYHDDRQVKFLYVDLDQGWQRDGENGAAAIFIVARRASDVTT